ncbi:MAG: inactive transglutaminase family protein [Phycisphaerae bacterium]|nr:inactive transglutaminase family protein [Phycisphaerae bacterium]
MATKRLSRLHMYVICGLLTALAVGRVIYKTTVLKYSLRPGKQTSIWLVEAQVTFTAKGGPVRVSLAAPDKSPGFKILDQNAAAAGYGFAKETVNGDLRAIWTTRNAKGRQTLTYRLQVYDVFGSRAYEPGPEPPKPTFPAMEKHLKTAAKEVLEEATKHSSSRLSFTGQLLRMMNRQTPSQAMQVLLGETDYAKSPVKLAIDLLAMKGIPARLALGVQLEDGKRRQPLEELLEVYTKRGWTLFDPVTGKRGLPPRFVLWQQGGESLLDIVGGSKSRISISVIRNVLPEEDLLRIRAEEGRFGTRFLSIYSLPVSEQNMIKKLLLVPLGALIVVLMRNVVGLTMSGTFMPVLIALAFMETRIVTGLLIFIVIVVVGLMIRSHLSRLNLLLVPRISACVIVVIILMTLMSVLSYRLGLPQGMAVTFFPMIIIAWTIERMSITAEESGTWEAVKQVSASLFTAVLVYLAITNHYVAHITFAFPEVTLIVLAAILLLGTYTGYRLLELRRFEPLVRK